MTKSYIVFRLDRETSRVENVWGAFQTWELADTFMSNIRACDIDYFGIRLIEEVSTQEIQEYFEEKERC